MKTVWSLFIGGLSIGGVVSVALHESRASSDSDSRIRRIEDTAISGLKVPVPSVSQTESALVKRESELNEKEKRIKEKEDQLVVQEQRLKIQLDEYQKLHDEIVEVQNKNKKENEAVLARLVKTFQTMNSKKAATVISAMTDQLATDLFMAMKEKSVASILEAMDPSRAMALSTLVAERRPAGKAIGEKQAQ